MKYLLFVLFTITQLTSIGAAKDSTLFLYSDELKPSGDRMFVRFSNKEAGDVIIRIYNDQGSMIKEFIDKSVEPGFHQVLITLSAMRAGKYALSIQLNSERCSAIFIMHEEK